MMYIKFNDGAQFDLCGNPIGAAAVLAGHRRDVLTVTVTGEFAAVKAAFGQPWVIVDGENNYDKANYTLPVSVCDNLDGTVTVRVGRMNTREEDLEDEKNALRAENAALAADKAALETSNAALTAELQDKDAQIDDLVVEMLEGGTDNVSETAETV